MRSLQIQVPAERAQRVLELAERHGARTPVTLRAERAGGQGAGDWSVVLASVPNERVGVLLETVGGEVAEATFLLMPVGTLPITVPIDQLDERVRDVSTLSTLEVVASSLQSVGAWKGLLAYSALAGVVGAYGLIFDVTYLLVAAMLINPMGAPAVVAVIGIAVGDGRMFARGGARFVASLVVQAAAALALGVTYGLNVSTAAMEQVTSLSVWSALLAFAAGAAGAQAQIRSERDSLISGTAAGFMVAAALAPPAAVLGLSVPLGRWDYFGLMAFLLLLQFVAIAGGGALALYLLGVRPRDPSLGRGRVLWRNLLGAVIVPALIGLVWLQAGLAPRYTKADLSRAALEIARAAVDATPGVYLVESNAHFTRPRREATTGEGLLFDVTVARAGAATSDDAGLEAAVRERIRSSVAAEMTGVTPFVRVTVLPAPMVRH